MAEICWFCSVDPADIKKAVVVRLYRDAERSDFKIGQTTRYEVRYKRGTASVPRCLSCFEEHLRVSRLRNKITLGGAGIGLLVGLILFFVLPADLQNVYIFGGCLFMAVLGSIVGFFLCSILIRSKTRSESTATQHPGVTSMLNNGWLLGVPNPKAKS
jgi:hypothetical protein